MKSQKSANSLRNPFYNRFNDPVRRRNDDEQAHEYTLWLKEQNRILPPTGPALNKQDTEMSLASGPFSSRVAGVLVIVAVILLSVVVLAKSL